MQEALIHLWQIEEERPQQTRSWYLQSCHFHLRHYMASGRSIDSWKRRESLTSFATPETEEEERGFSVPATTSGDGISDISAGEILRLLGQRLTAPQRRVLDFLADGLSSREIGAKLGVSHKAIIKHRRRIASTALQLGISPLNFPA